MGEVPCAAARAVRRAVQNSDRSLTSTSRIPPLTSDSSHSPSPWCPVLQRARCKVSVDRLYWDVAAWRIAYSGSSFVQGSDPVVSVTRAALGLVAPHMCPRPPPSPSLVLVIRFHYCHVYLPCPGTADDTSHCRRPRRQ